jgi:hypothetical protein
MPARRTKPRISANALIEYMRVGSSRRRKIVEEQQKPADFMVIYYQPASDAIARFIANGPKDDSQLVSAIESLLSTSPKSDWDATRNQANADAISSFRDMQHQLRLRGASAKRASTKMPKLEFAGATLSVQPELILHNAGGDLVGAIKFYFSKKSTARLDDESGGYLSALVWHLLTSNGGKPEHSRCITVDIFGQTIHTSPRAFRRLLNDVTAACEEIVLRWG